MIFHCARPTRAFLSRALRKHRRSSGSIPSPLCNPNMTMSALAQVDMSSSLRDDRPSQGGSDGQRGQGHHEREGTQAGALLGLTTRHIRRLIARVEQAGDQGLAHRGRGKPSNRRIPEKVKTTVLKLYEKQYEDFGPTLAAEKLAEYHGITISAETMRGWLRDAGIDHFTRRKRPHRAWRERRAHVGELVQLDGSHHDWFEGRGPRCVLMAYIDDASSRVYARFYAYEGTIPAMDSFMRYGQQ